LSLIWREYGVDGKSKVIAKDGHISLAGVALVGEIRQSTDPCVASESTSVTVSNLDIWQNNITVIPNELIGVEL
jgi:hypothetical protein